MKKEYSNNRACVRLDSQIQVDFSLDDEVSILYSYNLSREGMFLETVCPYPEGTRFALRFNLPDSSKTIHSVVEVVYSLEETQDEGDWQLPGMGVHFVALDNDDRELIAEFLNEEERSAMRPKSEE
ncbi:MAG: PilZ domain-containing protein [Holophagae bacterium]|nr:PilZ domain-containing protein [Holophagae bacterium]